MQARPLQMRSAGMSIIAGQGEGGSRTVLDYLPKVFPLETALPYGLLAHLLEVSPKAASIILLAFALMTPLALWLHGLRVHQQPPALQYVVRTAAFLVWSCHPNDPLIGDQAISGKLLSLISAAIGLLSLLLLQRQRRPSP